MRDKNLDGYTPFMAAIACKVRSPVTFISCMCLHVQRYIGKGLKFASLEGILRSLYSDRVCNKLTKLVHSFRH